MKRETHLTTQEKIMNMEKLGTVSALGVRPPKLMKPNNGGACRVTTYTLCDKLAGASLYLTPKT